MYVNHTLLKWMIIGLHISLIHTTRYFTNYIRYLITKYVDPGTGPPG